MLAMASLPALTSLTYSLKPATKRQESSFRCDARKEHARHVRSLVTDSGEALVWDAASVLRSAVQWALV